ncbi:MAG: DUF86 domain-containing protein [Armatimonadetes bacterium]|nr:DUF86 domain-containing protein [Armatimonadota bacterium]
MRDEGLYLEDIVEAADSIRDFLSGCDRDQFDWSEMMRSAVLHKLLIIGEAAAHVSAGTRARHQDIEWADIVAFRNFAIHAYFAVDWDRVWDAAMVDAPVLREKITDILLREFPESQDED